LIDGSDTGLIPRSLKVKTDDSDVDDESWNTLLYATTGLRDRFVALKCALILSNLDFVSFAKDRKN
jgi:hypothetical protein